MNAQKDKRIISGFNADGSYTLVEDHFSYDDNNVKKSSNLDNEAHRAATSSLNLRAQPTDKQAKAGNYKKGHVVINGIRIAIENPAGSKRKPEWPNLTAHYGYVKGTIGTDGGQIDIFLRPGTPTDWKGNVFVIDQLFENGEFDENKVMFGWDNERDAKRAYLSNYSLDWKGFGNITEITQEQFKQSLRQNATNNMNKIIKKVNISLLKSAINRMNKGDVVGHEFHGNQWTGGTGSDNSLKVPTSYEDIDRFISDAEKTPEYQKALKDLEALGKETKSGNVTEWSVEKHTDENGKYTEERTAKHEEIVAKALTESSKADEGTRPVAVLLIGQPGAGKTSSSKEVLANITDKSLVTINADDIKAQFTEYQGWNAGALHEESTHVAENMLVGRAIEGNHNMLFDAVGKNSDKMNDLTSALTSKGYDVHVINVTTQPHISLPRVYDRFLGKEKRFVDLKYAQAVGFKPNATYEALKNNSDIKSWHQFENSGTKAVLLDKGKR